MPIGRKLTEILDSGEITSIVLGALNKAYKAGQITNDPDSYTILLDTGFPGVRVNSGQEEQYLVYNPHVSNTMANGKNAYASGTHPTLPILSAAYADNGSFQTSAQVIGKFTMDIEPESFGLVTSRGVVRGWDTTGITDGLTYLGTNGDDTPTKPLYPATRWLMGVKLKDGVTDGEFMVAPRNIIRKNASASYTFTSADAAAGKHYRAGFYDWAINSVTLNQGSLTQTYGAANLSRAAHAGVVPSAAGTVDAGQVGLQVTGTLDSEIGPQQTTQTKTITDDITTLTANVMKESLEKFSGQITLELYVVSGTPVNYALTFNYGFSAYEDFANIDATVIAMSVDWEAGANDSVFDVSLKYHNDQGWTYAASGFEPGNGDICNRLTDQAIESDISSGVNGKYKRVALNQFVEGSNVEGILIEIITGSTLSIRNMDIRVAAVSEELD